MVTETVDSFISGISKAKIIQYRDYWHTLKPTTFKEKFQRWLFAFASVHTTWESNVNLYNCLKDCEWLNNDAELYNRIKASRAGLYNNRTKFISDFSTKFWADPAQFEYRPGESWFDLRQRIDKYILGLGRAKIAFAFEMLNPVDVQLVCTDVHVLKAYGYTSSSIATNRVNKRDVDAIERHWLETCGKSNVSPALARFIYWDTKQGKANSRYWSNVLESEDKKELFNLMEQKHMELDEAKNEFIELVSNKLAIELPDTIKPYEPQTVTELINWFLTGEINELRPISVANWSIKKLEYNYVLTCNNKNLNGEAVLFARPMSIGSIIIGNYDYLRDRKDNQLTIITDDMFNKMWCMWSFKSMQPWVDNAGDFKINGLPPAGVIGRGYDLVFTCTYVGKQNMFKFVKFPYHKMLGCVCSTVDKKRIAAVPLYVDKDDKIIAHFASGSREEYQWNYVNKLIDQIEEASVVNEWGMNKDYDLVDNATKQFEHDYDTALITSNNSDERLLSSLKCILDPTYGSARGTQILADHTFAVVDGFDEIYIVNATAVKIIDGEVFVKGIIKIDKQKHKNIFIMPIITQKTWKKLVIPKGLTKKEHTDGN